MGGRRMKKKMEEHGTYDIATQGLPVVGHGIGNSR